MKTVLMLMRKGGTSKSLCADCLAWSCERSGLKTQFINLDLQGGTVHETNVDAVPDPDIRIVDTPGKLAEDAGKWVAASDLVVIPSIPSTRDLEPLKAATTAYWKYRKPDAKLVYVISHWSRFTVSRDFESMLKKFPNDGIYRLPYSELFIQATGQGMSIVEYAPRSNAAKYMKEFCNGVRTLLGFDPE